MFSLQGVALNMSSAYHPQSDGQTEFVNQCVESYLRCMCSDRPHLWSKWLPQAEYWYNTNYRTTIQTAPYEAVHGQAPPIHLPYLPGESKVAVIAKCLQESGRHAFDAEISLVSRSASYAAVRRSTHD